MPSSPGGCLSARRLYRRKGRGGQRINKGTLSEGKALLFCVFLKRVQTGHLNTLFLGLLHVTYTLEEKKKSMRERVKEMERAGREGETQMRSQMNDPIFFPNEPLTIAINKYKLNMYFLFNNTGVKHVKRGLSLQGFWHPSEETNQQWTAREINVKPTASHVNRREVHFLHAI